MTTTDVEQLIREADAMLDELAAPVVYQHERRATVRPPEQVAHMRDHTLCTGQRSERRLGPFVSRIWRCAVCGREEHEVVYRPRWWHRLFA